MFVGAPLVAKRYYNSRYVCCLDINDDIVSLPVEKLKYYYDRFFETEEISDDDVQADIGFTYCSW